MKLFIIKSIPLLIVLLALFILIEVKKTYENSNTILLKNKKNKKKINTIKQRSS